MTAVLPLHTDDGVHPGQFVLWSSAALAAFAAHAGFVAWALHNPTASMTAAAAPEAVMIELAPVPAAPDLAEPEISQDSFDAPEIAMAPPDTTAPMVPAETEPPPMPPMPMPPDVAETPVSDDLPILDIPPVPVPDADVAASPPRARPENLTRVKEPPTPRKVAQKSERTPPSEPPSKAARKAAAATPVKAAVAAARQTSRGSPGKVSESKWQSRLLTHLERNKRYPPASRKRRQEGVAHVRFSIDTNGRVLSAAIARSSGFDVLDQEVLAMVRRASPVPAPPPGAPLTITAPVQFKIR